LGMVSPTTILSIPSFRRVIPVKTGAESIYNCEESDQLDSLPMLGFLDAPVSSTGQAYQVRHDGVPNAAPLLSDVVGLERSGYCWCL